jgi:hypothetical protein
MLLEPSKRMLARNTLTVMPDERAAAEAARRKKAAARQTRGPAPAETTAQTVPSRRVTPLKIVGWVAYLVAAVIFVLFVLLWIRGDISKSQQLYPLPGVASGFLIVGVWTVLGPALYRSRTTATRAGKYVLAVLVTIIFYPLIVTGVSSLAEWIVSLFPGHTH